MIDFRRLLKEGSWIIIGQIATVAGTLVLVRVLTGYLDPAQYGDLALGLTVAGLVNQVVMGGITAGIGRFYSIAVEKQDLGGYLQASRYLLAYAALVVVAAGSILLVGLLLFNYSRWMGLAAASLVFSVFSGYNAALSGIYNAARQRAMVAFHSGLDAWLKMLLAVGVILWLGASSTVVVIGYICASLLVTVSQLLFLRRTFPTRQTRTGGHQLWLHQIWSYSWPFSTWGVFTWMQQVSDRWALQAFASPAEVGQYTVLFQLGFVPITMVTGMAMSFLGPVMYQRSGDATDPTRNANVHLLSWRMTHISLILALFGFAIAYGIHGWLFSLLVSPGYRQSSYLLPWAVLAGGIFASGQMLALKLMSEMKAAMMSSAKIITALLGVLLNVIGAALAGMDGVVGALVAFASIYFFWMSMLARRLFVKGLTN